MEVRGLVGSDSDETPFVYCDPCKYDQKIALADTFCLQCNEHLCPRCKHFHTKFQATRNHTYTNDFSTPKKESKPLHLKSCDIHKTNDVKFYCNDHKCVICTICKASAHSNCSVQLINEIVQYSKNKHQLNLTKDFVQHLIKCFENLMKKSSKNMNDVKEKTLHYRTKVLGIKGKFGEILDLVLDDISAVERESAAQHLEEIEMEQVYHDAVSDLNTLSRNIEEVIESNDAVATFSGGLKALRLTEEYSFIERKMTVSCNDLSANFQKFQQMIDEFDNCLMLCELYMKQPQAKPSPVNTERDVPSKEMGSVAKDRTMKYQAEVSLASVIGNLDPTTKSNKEETHSDSLQNKKDFGLEKLTTLSSTSGMEDIPKSLHQKVVQITKPSTENRHFSKTDSSKALSVNQAERDKNIYVKTQNPKLYSKVVKTPPTETSNLGFNITTPSKRKHCVIRTQKDKKTCDITGSTFLPDGRLALCDHENMNIKLSDKDFEVTHSFKLETKPWDLTVTAEHELAVTLPMSKTVLFVAICNGTMRKCRKFQVKQDVWGIDSCEDLLIISLHDINNTKSSVEIRKHSGELVKEIRSDMFGQQFFKSPGYVFVEKPTGKIFVSDGERNAIFCFTQYGLMVGKFEDGSLRWPRKIINDSDKNLIVCSMCSDSLKLLPPGKNQFKTFISNCIGPQTVSYRETDKLLIVGLNLSDTLLILQ